MSKTLAAEFETRRDAEMTVEHLVQEHGMNPKAIVIAPASSENSAGIKVAGSDNESGHDKNGSEAQPALAGRLRVSVEADEALADKVLSSFSTYGGKQVV